MHKVEMANLKTIGTPYFATLEYTKEAAKDLDLFHKLVDLRAQYREFRPMSMESFVVNGTWMLDQFGQLSNISIDNYGSPWPEELVRELQRIRNEHEVYPAKYFHERLRQFGFKGSSGYSVGGGNYRLPLSESTCSVCDKGWNMSNTHDCFHVGKDLIFETPVEKNSAFVGMTPFEIRRMPCSHEGYEATLDYINPVKNSKFIDLTPSPEVKGHVENKEGWLSTHYTDKDKPYHIDEKKYTVEVGDVLIYQYSRMAHFACKVKKVTQEIRQKFFDAFCEAGNPIVGCIEIPNAYTDEVYGGKWFIVQTSVGLYRVGWRRRVITLIEMEIPKAEYNTVEISKVKDCDDVHFDTYKELTKHLKEKMPV